MREESFYDPPEILSFDEAQRLLDRGESRIVDFGGALILGDPGSVLILRRRGVCLKRGNIVGSGGLVEFAVRAGDGEVHEQVRHTVLLVEADDAEVSESLVCGCERSVAQLIVAPAWVPSAGAAPSAVVVSRRTSAAPSCTVTVQGAVLGVALRRCTIEGDGVEAAFREHFGSFADAQDMLYTSHGAPWGCDGVHIIGRGTEADVTGCRWAQRGACEHCSSSYHHGEAGGTLLAPRPQHLAAFGHRAGSGRGRGRQGSRFGRQSERAARGRVHWAWVHRRARQSASVRKRGRRGCHGAGGERPRVDAGAVAVAQRGRALGGRLAADGPHGAAPARHGGALPVASAGLAVGPGCHGHQDGRARPAVGPWLVTVPCPHGRCFTCQ